MTAANLPDLDFDTASHTGQRIRGYSVERVQSLMNTIVDLESQMSAVGAGGVESLRKQGAQQPRMVPLDDVIARLEQGFGAGCAAVTTLQNHYKVKA